MHILPSNMIKHYNLLEHNLSRWLLPPQQILLLGLRLSLAWVFFKSGLVKLQSWEATVALFEYEYAVPYLVPQAAALLATVAELSLPPLLALGGLTRLSVLALFVFNAVAIISYPDISPAGLKDHQLWGLGLACLFFVGAGKLSLDYLLTLNQSQPKVTA